MKFQYKKYAPGIIRPVIPIEIGYKNNFIFHEVLVDSGADICIFDAQIGKLIGLDIQKGQKNSVCGITGIDESYYIHSITIKVGGFPFRIKAGFLPNIASLGYGVVGQKGFFDLFVVKFDLIKEEIELKKEQRMVDFQVRIAER